eukprot:SAG22_NODE_1814_length_3518_cov_7.770693_2_plen_580_part_00
MQPLPATRRRAGPPMYSGDAAPDVSGISKVADDGDTTMNSSTLPSIHIAGDSPSPGPGGAAAESAYSVERDGMPRVNKSGIHIPGGQHIRFSSPRCKKALRLSGIQPGQLQPRARDDFSLGAKLPAVADRRFEAFEELRARHLQLVLDARAAQPKPAKKGKKAQAGRGDDTATLLKMEAQQKARILQAAKNRMQEDERAKIAAEQKREEKLLEQRRVEHEIHRRREEREEEFAARRDASIRDQRRREAKKAAKVAEEEAEAGELEKRAAEKQAKIDAELAVRQERFRKRRLQFADKTAARVAALAEVKALKQQEAVELADETDRRMRQRDRRIAKEMEAERQRVAEVNRQASAAAEVKRLTKKEKDKRAKLAAQQETLQKLADVDARLAQSEERNKKEFAAKRREEEFKQRARQKVQADMARERQQSAGDSLNKTERKEQVLQQVVQRREAVLLMKTEEQRLNFEAKRQNIERMQRVWEYEHQLKREAVMEKDRRLAGLVESKKQLRLERKAMAQQFLMDKKVLAGEMEEMLRQRQRAAFTKDQQRLLEDQAAGLGRSDAMLSNWRGNPTPSRAATSMF